MNLWDPVWLTVKLAVVTTVLLMLLALPLAWWLAGTRSRLKPVVEAVTALPLVLPPTVLGFYLLVMFSPANPLGAAFVRVTGQSLTFSFTGLVIASMIYSLPFAVQPLQSAFQTVGRGLMEAGRTLGATRADLFRSLVLPLSRRGILTATVLTFTHTLGEFGVVLMVGGSIPGQTRVISIEIFTAVETLDYATAHWLSGGLVAVSFVVLVLVYGLNGGFRGLRHG